MFVVGIGYCELTKPIIWGKEGQPWEWYWKYKVFNILERKFVLIKNTFLEKLSLTLGFGLLISGLSIDDTKPIKWIFRLLNKILYESFFSSFHPFSDLLAFRFSYFLLAYYLGLFKTCTSDEEKGTTSNGLRSNDCM